jgi:hypothetical protein
MVVKEELSELLLYFSLAIIFPFAIFLAVLVCLAFTFPIIFNTLSLGVGVACIFLALVTFILYFIDKMGVRHERMVNDEKFAVLNEKLDILQKSVDNLKK